MRLRGSQIAILSALAIVGASECVGGAEVVKRPLSNNSYPPAGYRIKGQRQKVANSKHAGQYAKRYASVPMLSARERAKRERKAK